MDAPVLLQPLVADGLHVGLFVFKMGHRMAFEILDSLLACPLAVLFLLAKGKQLIDNLKQPLVLLVDHFHADIIFIPPFKFSFHSHNLPVKI